MNGDEPDRPPPGVDLVALAGLVAPLLAPHTDADEIAQRCAKRVVEQLLPLVQRIEKAAQVERRTLGPYVPPPPTTTN
ncbi:hypothetical protein [Pseudonocardia adelaidensis]|uniref:Uncharacterized protein n=1 Tax=Pseudonocardia adelaidensis TaxID=648754 RepID=A0ABP9NS42_9PSEU